MCNSQVCYPVLISKLCFFCSLVVSVSSSGTDWFTNTMLTELTHVKFRWSTHRSQCLFLK